MPRLATAAHICRRRRRAKAARHGARKTQAIIAADATTRPRTSRARKSGQLPQTLAPSSKMPTGERKPTFSASRRAFPRRASLYFVSAQASRTRSPRCRHLARTTMTIMGRRRYLPTRAAERESIDFGQQMARRGRRLTRQQPNGRCRTLPAEAAIFTIIINIT